MIARESSEAIFAVAHRRWWFGGGYDVLQGPGWPTKLAWFRNRHHAIAFVRIFSRKWADANEDDSVRLSLARSATAIDIAGGCQSSGVGHGTNGQQEAGQC